MMKFVCTACGREEDTHTRKSKCDCGGLWELSYTPPKFTLEDIDRDTWSIFRYRKFMALTGDTWRDVTLGEGMTPSSRSRKGYGSRWITSCPRFLSRIAALQS